MPRAAIVGAALNDASSRVTGLYLGGVDVVRGRPVGSLGRYGVPESTIVVDELGAGGVSTMSFVIDDPMLEIEILPGMDVRYQHHDATRAVPIFLGWVDSFTYRPSFGDQGREIVVGCVGVEAFLDWSLATVAYAVPPGIRVDDAIQIIVSYSAGLGVPIRALCNNTDPIFPAASTYAFPIGGTGNALTTAAITVTAGTTLRAALQQLQAVAPIPQYVSIDFAYGLRTYDPQVSGDPADYQTIDITAGLAEPGEAFAHVVDAAAYRSVQVVGTGASATVTDGSGIPGPMGRLEDPTITDAGTARAAGMQFLARNRTTPRGTFSLTDHPAAFGGARWFGQTHPGSRLRLTDARAEVDVQTAYVVTAMRRTFAAGGDLESVDFTYGDLPPSLVRLVRRQTRGTLS